MKKRWLPIVLISVTVILASLLTSCSFINKILGKDGEEISTPIVESIELLKATAKYKESNEYIYNSSKQTEKVTPMAIENNGKIQLVLNYHNPKGYAISYVTVNSDRYVPTQFADGSSKEKTIIELEVGDNPVGTELGYQVKNVFFNAGSETKRVKFAEGTKTSFAVVVAPSFKLTLNLCNADLRASSTKPEADVNVTTKVAFGSTMNTVGLADPNYRDPSGLPEKSGGYVFEGWFTEEGGKGIMVKGTDKFYFWSDVVLYAHFTRLFKYKIVELDEPIKDTATGKTYTSGAIITEDDSRGKYPNINIDNTIYDEKTNAEYPVIKIANRAFKDINNIVNLTIGKFVKEIGAYAFDGSTALNSVIFNSGSCLKYIGDYAFRNTRAMGINLPFTLPETVEYLGNYAFYESGWKITTNAGGNESTLHIRPTYKFIGYGCFVKTGFNKVIFEPGCHYESQIGEAEGKQIEHDEGWLDVRPELNRIGGQLFGGCVQLTEVDIQADPGQSNALNIIPDLCFDGVSYKGFGGGEQKHISVLKFNEGIEYIGRKAFEYQTLIPFLNIPASVKEVDYWAFYACTAVAELTFAKGSQLEILHRQSFGNMTLIDRVVIVSENFRLYGDGPFAGCTRLKSIEFPNIYDVAHLPRGYSRDEKWGSEVATDEDWGGVGSSNRGIHKYTDFICETFVHAQDEAGNTSSHPVRVFCDGNVMNAFKDRLLEGKAAYVFNKNGDVESIKGTELGNSKSFTNNVFVHNINNVVQYDYSELYPNATDADKDRKITIAFQEIYDTSGKQPIAYSIVYWADRMSEINLPSRSPDGNLPIIELGMYALPSTVVTLNIPSNIERLEEHALDGCSFLQTVNGTENLKYIGDYAFFGTRIGSFVGGDKLTVIGLRAFNRCTVLRWVDLSQTLITNNPEGKTGVITSYKYDYEIDLSYNDNKPRKDYINALGAGAFQGCSSLRWIYMPYGLKQMSNGLFAACKNLATVILPCSLDGVSDFYEIEPSATYPTTDGLVTTIYVPSGEQSRHISIYSYGTYDLISNAPARPE